MIVDKIPDAEVRIMLDEIFEWYADNKWFDPAFIIKMDSLDSWSYKQSEAVNNIYEHFVKGKNNAKRL